MGFEMVARLSCEANHQKLHYKHNLHPSNPTIQKPGEGDNATEPPPPPPRHRCRGLSAMEGWGATGNEGEAPVLLKERSLLWFF